MTFKNGNLAIIHSTNSDLDHLIVRVVGLIHDFAGLPGSIYAIERPDGNLFETGYKVMGLTDSCLTLVD